LLVNTALFKKGPEFSEKGTVVARQADRGQVSIVVVKEKYGQANLFQMVAALGAAGRLARGLNSGQ
jgi:hypothetical protein